MDVEKRPIWPAKGEMEQVWVNIEKSEFKIFKLGYEGKNFDYDISTLLIVLNFFLTNRFDSLNLI